MIIEKYFATWCNPCKMLDPIIDELKEEFPKVTFEAIDIEKDPNKVVQNQIRSVPVIIFKDEEGKELSRILGAQPKKAYKEVIEEYGWV